LQENDDPLQVQTTIPIPTDARKRRSNAGANNNSYPNKCKKTMTHCRCNVYSTSPQFTSQDSDTVLDEVDLSAPANESRFHTIPHAYQYF